MDIKKIDNLLDEAKKKRKKRKKRIELLLAPFFGVPGKPSPATMPPYKPTEGPTASPPSGAYPGAGGKNSPSVPMTNPNHGTGPVGEQNYSVHGDGVVVNKPIDFNAFTSNTKSMTSNTFVNDPKNKIRYEIFVDSKQLFHLFSLKTDKGDPRHGVNPAHAQITHLGVFKTIDGAKNFIKKEMSGLTTSPHDKVIH